MDPNRTFAEIISLLAESSDPETAEAVLDRLTDLLIWWSKGGFAPDVEAVEKAADDIINAPF